MCSTVPVRLNTGRIDGRVAAAQPFGAALDQAFFFDAGGILRHRGALCVDHGADGFDDQRASVLFDQCGDTRLLQQAVDRG